MTTPLPPDDDDLPGEAELRALYRKLPDVAPPPALDQAVRRAATEALDRRNTSVYATRRHRRAWPLAWGSAAVVVLAAGLVWQLRDLPSAVPGSAAPMPSGTTSATSSGAPAHMREAEKTVAASSPPVPRSRAADVVTTAAPTPPHKPPPKIIPQLALPSPQGNAPASLGLRAPSERAQARRESASVVLDDNTSSRRAYRATTQRNMDAEARARGVAPPAPPPAVEEVADAPVAAPPPQAAGATAPASPSPAAPTRAAPSATAERLTEAVPPVADTAWNQRDTPAQELAKIGRLLDASRADEARVRLQSFHHAHPEYVLSPRMQALLRP